MGFRVLGLGFRVYTQYMLHIDSIASNNTTLCLCTSSSYILCVRQEHLHRFSFCTAMYIVGIAAYSSKNGNGPKVVDLAEVLRNQP